MAENLVFVYGTLLKGYHGNNTFLSGSEFVCKASITGELYHLPFGYPAVVYGENKPPVFGEVYSVSDEVLGWIRKYEGTDSFNSIYRETVIPALTDDKELKVTAFVANYSKEVIVKYIGTRVDSGDWHEFEKLYKISRVLSSIKAVSAAFIMMLSVFLSIFGVFQHLFFEKSKR